MIRRLSRRTAKFSEPLHIDNGTLEALKWLALVLMTGDHVNKYVFADSVSGLFELGRIAMPLFMLALAYNLARPGAFQAGVHRRVGIRLVTFGALATLPYIAITGVLGGWWPLNMLFTLLLLTLICWLIDHGTPLHSLLAVVAFSLGGVPGRILVARTDAGTGLLGVLQAGFPIPAGPGGRCDGCFVARQSQLLGDGLFALPARCPQSSPHVVSVQAPVLRVLPCSLGWLVAGGRSFKVKPRLTCQ